MKVKISEQGQMQIVSESRYEMLALEHWYDQFRRSVISESYRMPTIGVTDVPMLQVILSMGDDKD